MECKEIELNLSVLDKYLENAEYISDNLEDGAKYSIQVTVPITEFNEMWDFFSQLKSDRHIQYQNTKPKKHLGGIIAEYGEITPCGISNTVAKGRMCCFEYEKGTVIVYFNLFSTHYFVEEVKLIITQYRESEIDF